MRYLLLLYTLFTFSSAAFADGSSAYNAYFGGNYKLAFKLYSKEAHQGDKEAQYFLGLMYRDGRGTEADYEKALKWQKAAAAQNYILSIHEIGLAYMNGIGVETDVHEAIKYFHKAHELQNPRSSQALAVIYLFGHDDIKADIKKGKTYLQQGLRFGMPLSMSILGLMYLEGLGYPKNEYRAFLLFIEAANLGSESAKEALKDFENDLGMPMKTYLHETYGHTLPLSETRICPSPSIKLSDCTIIWND